jgi:hypothetical protein
MSKGREGATFLKKSGAKNFYYSGAGMFERPWPRFKKVFAPARAASLFSKSGCFFRGP